jgi:hypothetical protein
MVDGTAADVVSVPVRGRPPVLVVVVGEPFFSVFVAVVIRVCFLGSVLVSNCRT